MGRSDVHSPRPLSTLISRAQLMKISRSQLHLTARDGAWHVACAGGSPSLLHRYDCEPVLLSKGAEREVQNGDVLWLLAEACLQTASEPSAEGDGEERTQLGPLVVFLEPAEPTAAPSAVSSGPGVMPGQQTIMAEHGGPAGAAIGESGPRPAAEHSAACAAACSWVEERRLRDGSFFVCNVPCESPRANELSNELSLDPRRQLGTLVLECNRPLPATTLEASPVVALSARWCDGVETFCKTEPRFPWLHLPREQADLHAKVLTTFFSGTRDVLLCRRTNQSDTTQIRIESSHERVGARPGEATCSFVAPRRIARSAVRAHPTHLDSLGAQDCSVWCPSIPYRLGVGGISTRPSPCRSMHAALCNCAQCCPTQVPTCCSACWGDERPSSRRWRSSASAPPSSRRGSTREALILRPRLSDCARRR